jgi:7-carboxy-7-deazaguanine synthase
MSLKVNEIFYSIQGESTWAGYPCAFVRLTGCNLRCAYCDTSYAYEDGREMSVSEIVDAVSAFPASLVEITGGEPLFQPKTHQLIRALADRGLPVLLETNGSISLEGTDDRATVIMDIKCPGSGMSGYMQWENVARLKPQDEVKFVLSDRGDYEWALDIIKEHKLGARRAVHLAPAFGRLEPALLASWMLESRRLQHSNIRLQLQLHKYIWPHVERGV